MQLADLSRRRQGGAAAPSGTVPGARSLAADTLGTSVLPFVTALVATGLVRCHVRRGRVPPLANPPPAVSLLPHGVVLRALVLAGCGWRPSACRRSPRRQGLGVPAPGLPAFMAVKGRPRGGDGGRGHVGRGAGPRADALRRGRAPFRAARTRCVSHSCRCERTLGRPACWRGTSPAAPRREPSDDSPRHSDASSPGRTARRVACRLLRRPGWNGRLRAGHARRPPRACPARR